MIYGQSQELADALPFIQRWRPRYWKWIANTESPNYTADLAAAKWCHENGVKLVVRNANWQYDRGGHPELQSMRFRQSCQLGGWLRYASFIETPNEPMTFLEITDNYIRFEELVVKEFANAGLGEIIVGNMGTHQPFHYVPGARYYGLHAYFGTLGGWPPDRLSQWESIRAQNPEAECFFTEIGFTDALNRTVPPGEDYDFGWQRHITAAAYIERLVEFGDDCRYHIHGYLGSFLFQAGAQKGGSSQSGWSSFETLGTPVEDYLLSQKEDSMVPHEAPDHSDLTTSSKDNGAPSLFLGEGMQTLAVRLGQGETGAQLTGERYLGTDPATQISYAVFQKGKMEYYAGTGMTVWFPFS